MTNPAMRNPTTGAIPIVTVPADPARRADVLFRVRRDPGHELSAWWMIGAFVVSSTAVVLLLSMIPGTV